MTAQEKRLCKEFLLTACIGGFLGLFAGICSTAPQGRPLGNLLFGFGEISGSVLLWMTVCAWLALRTKCGLHAALSVMSFMGALLFGASLLSLHRYGHCGNMLPFWMMLMPAGIAAWVLRANRNRPWMRWLGCLAGAAAMIFDFFCLWMDTPPLFLGELALLIALFFLLLSGRREPARRMPAVPHCI